jgi:hypothetical protein
MSKERFIEMTRMGIVKYVMIRSMDRLLGIEVKEKYE